MTARRCVACRRRLRQPSPDGLGPKCRAKLTPPAAPTPGRSDTRPRAGPGPEQLALDDPDTDRPAREGEPTP